MNDTCEDHVEELGSVTEVGVACVVVIERPEVVEEASGNTYSFEDDEDVGVGDGRKRRTEVKEHEERRIADGVIWIPGGEEVGKPGPGIESNRVVDALAPQNEAVLLVVCPVTDGGGNLAVDDCGYGFVIGVFETEWARVVGSSVDAGGGVVVGGAFREKDSEAGVEIVRGKCAAHHGVLGAL